MTDSPDARAAELASRNATTQYRPYTDESEDASGDGIAYADESEWMDGYDDDDYDDDEGEDVPDGAIGLTLVATTGASLPTGTTVEMRADGQTFTKREADRWEGSGRTFRDADVDQWFTDFCAKIAHIPTA